MKTAYRILILGACACMPFLQISCTMQPLSGGGTIETTNGRIAVTMVTPDGEPAPETQVRLYPSSYNPLRDTSRIPAQITDESGRCTFNGLDSGSYSVSAVHLSARTRSLTSRILVSDTSVQVSVDTLRKSGAVQVMLPDSFNAENGYLYIPGTAIFSLLSNNNGYAILDSVPAGTVPGICYSIKNTIPASQIIRDSFSVTPGGTTVIRYVQWKSMKRVYLNTSASGASVTTDLENFPLLVRLSQANFSFGEAQTNGADLRFTKADGSLLPMEIERWDAGAQAAEIWVRVDTIKGNNSAQYILMYWGNASAPATSGAAVFDSSSSGGFQAVWHFNESAGTPVLDATGNHFNGLASDSMPGVILGPIGRGRAFNGTSNFIEIGNSASGKLNFPEHGTYTVSAWAYIDSFPIATDHDHMDIVSKGNFDYHLQTKNREWQFTEFQDQTGWSNVSANAQSGKWAYVSGVRSGDREYLFVNGVCVDSTITIEALLVARDTTAPVSIGRLGVAPKYYFAGRLDEIRMSNVARSAGWEKLCYMNQKALDALITFR